jgi:hypothetical protein
VDDRPGRGGLSGLGLGRHAWSGCNAGATGQTVIYADFRRIASRSRRNSVQDARKRMIVTVSSGARGDAAWTATTLDLETVAQRSLAGRAAGFTNLLVVASAGAGGLLLGVAGATVPNAFSKRHADSFRRAAAIAASAAARHMPVSRACITARFCDDPRAHREVRCRLLPPAADGLRTRR